MSILPSLIRLAYEHRLPDAHERIARAKVSFAASSASLSRLAAAKQRLADAWLSMAEDGIDYQFTSPDSYQVPLEEAAAALDAALAAQEDLKTSPNAEALAEVLNLEALLKHRKLKQPGEGPTAETLLHHTSPADTIDRLFEAGKISSDELRAAREIGGIYRHITAGLNARTMPYAVPTETAADYRWTARSDTNQWYALLHAQVYRPWATRMAGWLPMLLSIIINGNSLSKERKRWKIGYETIISRISIGLGHYVTLRAGHDPDTSETN